MRSSHCLSDSNNAGRSANRSHLLVARGCDAFAAPLRTLLLSGLCLLAGCAGLRPAPEAADSGLAQCERDLAAMDEVVATAGVRDGLAAKVPGFPHLRVNRFLVSFRGQPLDERQYAEWLHAMRALDQTAREYETANMPDDAAAALHAQLGEMPLARSASCGERLLARDIARPDARAALSNTACVPDDYDTWKRVLGLYPLARLPFACGVARYEAQTRTTFDTPLEALPHHGTPVWYVPRVPPPTDADVENMFAHAAGDALGRMHFHADELARIYAAFAPRVVIDTVADDDRIGTPTFAEDGTVRIETARPVVYTRLVYTRYAETVLPQLVYSMWFPARPLTSAFDLLGGHVDGITWRVTLDRDGRPVLYDSMHNCGCYHQFFPTARAKPRVLAATLDETALIPQVIGDEASRRPVLHVAAGTHYLQRISFDEAPREAVAYDMAPDDSLRSLPLPEGGRHSLFAPDGIVPGTSRRERFVFWPMGVRDPGAMRQWGRHATAFVGRRHFDEARLIERYFELEFGTTRPDIE